ncbi:hypothetical protein I7I51_00994 [Histoplasma capsulatum]|uniref:MADS-box domain-containing protein n=1 Tax=Ajellomyces capsulatus TaxID=5037 RepID=A0A8A1MGZ0_AJECA|nr:hypothetical protein I7I51_00994 [Histoplasma capsulatum]
MHVDSQTPLRSTRKRTRSQSQQDRTNLRQKRCRRRAGLFGKSVEFSDKNQADVYILIHINDQYFILNTNSHGTWPPPEDQIEKHYPYTVRKRPEDYRTPIKKKRGRKETLFRKSVEYGDQCGADVYIIVYVNNRYFTLNTNSDGTCPPSAKQIENHYPLPVYKTSEDYQKRPAQAKKIERLNHVHEVTVLC